MSEPGGAGGRRAHPLTRRVALSGAALGLLPAAMGAALAQPAPQPSPDRMQRPRKGDVLVFANGAQAGAPVAPDALVEGGPQALAWACDPATKAVRDGSRLNQVLLVRLAPGSLAEISRARAADGVVAYSAVCSHAQCPVSDWRKESGILHCPCHNSEYDPRDNAKVVNGPATRALASLPIRIDGGVLVVAEPFIGKVGNQA